MRLSVIFPQLKKHGLIFITSENYFLLQNLTLETDLSAANGKKIKALEIFAYALQYFKEQALKVKTLSFYFQLFIFVAVTNAVQPF